MLLIIMMGGTSPCLRAQSPPKRELRAVWLTTLSGLDWPSPASRGRPDLQKASLLRILDSIAAFKLNTVMFQVRSRGNAFYASAFEPWAGELTGTLGRDPGWDPLAFAVEECHRRGLEIHAWFNVFKVWSGGPVPRGVRPEHVAVQHPEWSAAYGTDLWLDPGIPAARAWCVDVAADLARRYDLDAIHFDYVRYPDADFKDADTWARYGRGDSKERWRRDNVTAFVRDAAARIRAVRPRMRIGAAPIGIYESLPTARGWQGLHAVSQDSRAWLREGIADYLAPQVYWGLRARGSSIDFEALVRDWSRASNGRHIYIGVAPYKPDVKRWLGEHIDACRAGGAGGEVFFRYEHVADNDFGRRYDTRALPPATPWLDAVRPNPPRMFAITRTNGTAQLHWQAPAVASDGESAWQYVIYRRRGGIPDIADPTTLLAVVPSAMTTCSVPDAGGDDEFAVTALDRTANESEPARSGAVLAGRLPAPSMRLPEIGVSDPILAPDGLVLVAYSLPRRSAVRLRLMDERGAEAMILVDEEREAGIHIVGIERDKLPEGIARCLLEAGSVRILHPFVPAE